jgi:hypothetical protein
MFVPVVPEYRTFDFSQLGAAGVATVQAGQYITTSGVKSGCLVVRASSIAIDNYAGAAIDIYVRAAWQDSAGTLAVDNYSGRKVAQITLNNTANTTTPVLIRADFLSPLPTPGLIVTVVGTMGSARGALSANLSIALELLPT